MTAHEADAEHFDAAWFGSVIDAMTEGIIVYDAVGHAVLANDQALSLLDLTDAQLKGRAAVGEAWKPISAEGSALAFRELPVATALRTGQPVRNLLIGIRHERGTRWISSNVSVRRDHGGVVQGAIATFRDATDVKVGRDIDRATQEMASRLVQAPVGSLDEVIDAHLATLGRVASAARVLYVGIDRVEGRARVTHDWSRRNERIVKAVGGLSLDLFAPLLGRLSRREVVSLVDRSELPEDRSAVSVTLARWGIEAAVTVPVLLDDVLCGFLVIGWGKPLEPDQQLLDFVVVAANLLASQFEREQVHADLQHLNASLDERVRERSAELLREQERTQALIDAIPDLMFELDPHGVFVTVHVPEPSMLVEPLADLVGHPVGDLFGGELRDSITLAIKRLRTSNALEIVEYSRLVDGVARRFECRLIQKDDGGVLAVVRDITGPAERQRLLREQSLKLARANQELERAVQARDEFLASVSHELRTPLNAILGHTEMLLDPEDTPLSETQQSSVVTIEASGRHLLELINDLLDLSRMNEQLESLALTDVPLDQLCHLVLELIRPRAVQKGVRLEFVDASGQPSIVADDRRMRQVLLNLLDNAMKFTDPGGTVGLQVWRPEASQVAFTVWDTGIGIDAGDHTRVFEPFAQVEAGLARRHHGSGLGLALVDRLVSLHHGWIELDSELGRGSRFSVVLPVAGPTPAEVSGPDGSFEDR